jgi:hypothetical protein
MLDQKTSICLERGTWLTVGVGQPGAFVWSPAPPRSRSVQIRRVWAVWGWVWVNVYVNTTSNSVGPGVGGGVAVGAPLGVGDAGQGMLGVGVGELGVAVGVGVGVGVDTGVGLGLGQPGCGENGTPLTVQYRHEMAGTWQPGSGVVQFACRLSHMYSPGWTQVDPQSMSTLP